jgi:uncharacterized protein (DUF924 family)
VTGEAVSTPADIIAFWRTAGSTKWFTRDEALDQAIRDRFAGDQAEAAAGRRDHWAESADSALALVILLDQFSRNLFRGSPQAFSQDRAALHTAAKSVASGFDLRADPALRLFFYLPYMHSERMADQQLSIRHFHALGEPDQLFYARLHERIIRRFGRFPHRNAVLGRRSSPAELLYLAAGGFAP